ncbi:hypothetical protein ACI8B_150023 [Acinetobacter proteolyticus]|uniref:Uncharacterized protein n=1 Tax=Acinetobacter proteolyticus TaxID=1776741 RepID=A0A653K1M7_9GAMM|nr:hypothetical protein ACI8B_150023 [Acinetobacter proteolyticus]
MSLKKWLFTYTGGEISINQWVEVFRIKNVMWYISTTKEKHKQRMILKQVLRSAEKEIDFNEKVYFNGTKKHIGNGSFNGYVLCLFGN